MSPLDPALVAEAGTAASWPFEQAKKIVARIEKSGKRDVLFETGYGPSGLPHIGTFGEVARTSMVRHAFHVLTKNEVPTRLLCFSDDMDGMRKVPDNVPDRAALEPYLHKPLTDVPNPFGGEHTSFAGHNNAMLRRFLDTFGFDYEFASATEYYRSGRFDEVLLRAAERYDDIMAVMLPTLGAERQATYSPFLPISPKTGRVLYVPMRHVDAKAGTVTFLDEDGAETTLPVTGGAVKLQWKPDFGMRWAALGVDFEMFGKDHQSNAIVYDRICTILGGTPPEHFVYELFLDQDGQKISKSKGNGLSIDEWLRYGTTESLALFMYQRPREAKKLHFDVIPRHVDEYLSFQDRYGGQDWKQRLGNPIWHIHAGEPPASEAVETGGERAATISFSMLMNLVAVANSEDPAVLWAFIRRYAPGASPETHPVLNRLVGHAVAYYRDRVRAKKAYRAPNEAERAALGELASSLAGHEGSTDADALQAIVYEVGRAHFPDTSGKSKSPDGRPGVSQGWFGSIYNVLLGEERGPRFGSFIALYGVGETRALIAKALAGELVREHETFLAEAA